MGRVTVVAVVFAVAASASAADLHWNGIGTAGSAGGGSGIWSLSTTSWETAASGGVPALWTDGDSGLFGGVAGTVDLQSSVIATSISATTTGYTLSSSNDSSLAVSRVDIAPLGANGQFTVSARLSGTSGLTLLGAGDTSATGGSNPNLGIRLANPANDFVGDAVITAGLVSYTSDGAFGAAANAIVLDGGGLLDNNVSVDLQRAISVQSGGGIVRLWNTSTPTWRGAISGAGPISRTDTGRLVLAGDLSAYSGTFTQVGYTTVGTSITGGGVVGGSWIASSGTITFDGAADQVASGAFGGRLRKTGASLLTLTSSSIGGTWLVDDGGGLVLETGSSQVITGVVSGSGPLAKTGGGTTIVAGRSTSSGTITVGTGTLRLNDGRSLSGPVQIAAAATLAVENNANGGYYQPSLVDLTDGSVVGVPTATNRYHGIYTEVIDVHGTGTSTIATPVFMNKLGDANAHTLTVTVDASAAGVISGAIANHPDVGGGSFVKAGSGLLTLSGASTFSGDAGLASGTTAVARTANSTNPTATALGDMTVTGRRIDVARGATLTFVSADAIGRFDYKTPVLLAAIGGTITRQYTTTDYFNSLGDVLLVNGGHLTSADGRLGIVQSFALNGTVSVSGTTGSFIDTRGSSFNGLHLGTVGGSTLFVVEPTGDPVADLLVSAPLVDRVLGGSAALVKAGDGTMQATVPNSYSGGSLIRAGRFITTVTGGLGTGPITLNDSLTAGSPTAVLIDATAASVEVSQRITVANEGAGTTTIGSAANAGVNFATFSGAITLARDVSLVAAAGGDRTEFTGGISGTGNVTVASGTAGRVLFLGAANTYSGATTVSAGGFLQLGDGAAATTSWLPDAELATIDGTLGIAKGGQTETLGGLLGSGTVLAIAAPGGLVVGEGGRSAAYAGVLADGGGSLSLTKTGTGAQTLTGANTHSGATSVLAGTLVLAGPQAAGASVVTVAAGGVVVVSPKVVTSVAGLDLSANGLVDVTSGGITVMANLSPAGLVAELLEGRGDGSWNGMTGITSSAAAAALAASEPRTVGWLDNGDGTVMAAFAAPADTNLDWNVDILDAANFLAGGKFDTGQPASWIEGDFGYDGIVDILDAADFLSTGLFDAGGYNEPDPASGLAAVPEPTLPALPAAIAAAAVFLFRTRVRQAESRGARAAARPEMSTGQGSG